MAHILHIIADDLRPDLNASYGAAHVRTPHLDGLAATGLTFKHAYAQYPLCQPSRASFLTSRRPEATRTWNKNPQADFRTRVPGSSAWLTLPETFKAAGWRVVGIGKVFHMISRTPRSLSLDYCTEPTGHTPD